MLIIHSSIFWLIPLKLLMSQILKKKFVFHYLYTFNLKLYFVYFQTLNSEKLSVFTAKFWFSYWFNKCASLLSSEVSPTIKFKMGKFTRECMYGSHNFWLRVHDLAWLSSEESWKWINQVKKKTIKGRKNWIYFKIYYIIYICK